MFNEWILLLTAVTDLFFVFFAGRLGKMWISMCIVTNILLVSIFGSELISVFGFTTNGGNVFYACIFVAMHMLIERYGKKAGYQMIWIGFSSSILFSIMSQFSLRMTSVFETQSMNSAIQTLFSNTPRIVLASMVSYLVAQYVNVWLYDWLEKKTKTRKLWLRDSMTTITGQALDSVLFFTIAFFAVTRFHQVLQIMTVGYIIKVVVGFAGLPFLYWIAPFKQRQDEE